MNRKNIRNRKKRKLNIRGKICLLVLILIIVSLVVTKNKKQTEITSLNENKHIIEVTDTYSIKIDIPDSKDENIEKEIKEWVDARKTEFMQSIDNELLKEKQMQYELVINYEQSEYNNIQSTHLVSYMYTGGNHYLRDDQSYYYDLVNNKEVVLTDFLKDKNNFKKIAQLSYFEVMEEIEKRKSNLDENWVKDGTEANIENYENFEFNEEGLNVLFPPYQVAPWSEGEIKVVIPYDKIKDIINFEIPENKENEVIKIERNTRDVENLKGKKVIAVTFDDGPSNKTEYLLQELEKEDWKVTFFVLGSRAKEYPELIKKMYKDGHEIGSHTYSHLNLKNLSDYEIYKEINNTNKIIEETIGIKPQYLRPPYGNTNDHIKEIADMTTILWNVDTLDWKSRNEDAVYKEIMKNASDGSIILLHDLYQTSIDGAIKAMKELEKQGYEFVTIDEMFKIKGEEIDKNKSYFNL